MVAALPIATFEQLKPHAIDIRVNVDPVHWFLSPAKDTRSSLSRPLQLSQFSLGEADGREEARAAALSEERLPCVANAGPAGNGDLRPAGCQTRQDAEPGGYEGVSRYLTDLGVPQV